MHGFALCIPAYVLYVLYMLSRFLDSRNLESAQQCTHRTDRTFASHPSRLLRFELALRNGDQNCISQKWLPSSFRTTESLRNLCARNQWIICWKRMNKYMPLISVHWRPNIDVTRLISTEAVIKYLAKYESKHEPSSNAMSQLRSHLNTIRTENRTPVCLIQSILMRQCVMHNYIEPKDSERKIV